VFNRFRIYHYETLSRVFSTGMKKMVLGGDAEARGRPRPPWAWLPGHADHLQDFSSSVSREM
jgi:hypothetical protein